MNLTTFSVRNYRSIIEAYKLSLGNYTVLVGPNNEGKSNIVKAIALSLAVLTKSRLSRRPRHGPSRYYRTNSDFYDWQRDFPVASQSSHPSGRSEFTLEFGLTPEDFENFREQVGVNLGTNLKIKVGLGQADVSVDVVMKGPGKKTLNDQKEVIGEFLRTHVASEYVPAWRSSEMALAIVDGLIQSELQTLEQNAEYTQTLLQLQKIQQPLLDKIAGKLQTTVSQFVPAVRSIRITNERMAQATRTSYSIRVDDGADTDLASKGDGIISLTTMSLVKHVSEEGLGSKSLILAIEEPESHLHPEAIHGLRQVLKEISDQQQVIITTHSPILVEREQVGQNIIVRQGHAARARRIEDIRDALGVHMSDTLVGAYLVLLVEGEEDKDLLTSLLTSISPTVRDAVAKRLFAIDHLGGATNLAYKVTFYRNGVCNTHAFLDADDEGRASVQAALERNLLGKADYNLTTCPGMRESEIEDLLDLHVYAPAVMQGFGVDLDQPRFRQTSAKWSDRAEGLFTFSGKMWNKSVKMHVKRTVVNACLQAGIPCLNSHRKGPFDALITSLEAKLAPVSHP
ncbi:MAG: AAA family ATPase [Chloroflexi bacterium]|nr:AAA family ATPase [Chloroflexota bacterium]